MKKRSLFSPGAVLAVENCIIPTYQKKSLGVLQRSAPPRFSPSLPSAPYRPHRPPSLRGICTPRLLEQSKQVQRAGLVGNISHGLFYVPGEIFYAVLLQPSVPRFVSFAILSTINSLRDSHKKNKNAALTMASGTETNKTKIKQTKAIRRAKRCRGRQRGGPVMKSLLRRIIQHSSSSIDTPRNSIHFVFYRISNPQASSYPSF